jgi:hypothetical protein
LVFKIEAQETQIAGLQGQCVYLHKHLKKLDQGPTKKETSQVNKDKEATPGAPQEDPKKQQTPKTTEEETSMETGGEKPADNKVKRRRTGNTKAYLAQFN